jgi:putative phage-type endonuclease
LASYFELAPTGADPWTQRRAQRHASESAAVMGASPWQSAQQLWRFKTGRCPAPVPPAGLSSCAERAEAAREAYRARTGFRMRPLEVVEGEYAASLDGVVLDGQLIVEIKCPLAGRDSPLWQLAVLGRIPEHYEWQLQHQLMVSGARLAHFYVFDGHDGVLIEHAPEAGRSASLRRRWDAFMHYVHTDRPPPPIDPEPLGKPQRAVPGALDARHRPRTH